MIVSQDENDNDFEHVEDVADEFDSDFDDEVSGFDFCFGQ